MLVGLVYLGGVSLITLSNLSGESLDNRSQAMMQRECVLPYCNPSFCDNDPCARGFTCDPWNSRCVLTDASSANITQANNYVDLIEEEIAS